MDLSFKTKKLRKVFNERTRLTREYGSRCASKIGTRMAALRAATNLHDFWPPMSGPERCHELTEGKRHGQLSMDLEHPYRLIFVPNHDPVPTREEGGLDWRQVTAVTIVGVEDTHG